MTTTIAGLKERRKRFRAACSLAGKDQATVAKELKVHPAHLSRVLNGHRIGRPVVRKIEAFIAKHLGEVAA